jgi:probable phosphoglycerate mutase
MLKIYLARHGQNIHNVNGVLNGHRDEPLTALGIAQAKTTADFIVANKLTFDVIYSSPLKRAHVTAEVIAQALELPQALIERDFGVMSGRLVSEIALLCTPDIIETDTITYFLSPAEAETFPDLIERGKAVLEEIKSLHSDGSVLLVTHGDIGKMIYAAYYDLAWSDVLVNFHFGNCEVLLLSEDSPAAEAHVFKQEQHNH